MEGTSADALWSSKGAAVLHRLLEGRAGDAPDAVCIQHVDGRAMTYQGVCDRFDYWAAVLARIGIQPGDRVATMLTDPLDALTMWLGIARLGAIEVPINTMYRGEMLRHLLSNSQPKMLVVGPQSEPYAAPVAAEFGVAMFAVGEVDPGCRTPAMPQDVDDPPALEGAPESHDIAAIIYTSGTTGPSKGVLVPWAELREFASMLPETILKRGDRFYAAFPANHVSGKAALFQATRFGACLVVRERFSPNTFWEEVHRFDVRAACLAGAMAAMLLQQPATAGDGGVPIEKVFMLPLIDEVEAFKQRFGVEVATAYGMTEIGVPLATPGFALGAGLSCGRLRPGYPGYQVRIVDARDEPVSTGTVGELVVRADEPLVMNAGYFNLPEATAAAWRNGWFHTGDAFCCENGDYFFVDRLKDAIRRRGENVSSFEVEMVARGHAGVADAAAIAVPSELGEDEIKLVVVPHADRELVLAELVEHMEAEMPPFMVPRYFEVMDDLPRTDGTLRVRKVVLRASAFNANTWDRVSNTIVAADAWGADAVPSTPSGV